MNDKQRARLAKVKKNLKDAGYLKKRKFVNLTCNICDREMKVRTNIPEAYTDSVKRKWICPMCKVLPTYPG